ncbi:myb family transcription factor [Tasmannia lanceolata]|uniref:myb family transcription factor n=1 Tax=Tasmannia lanceolata TaxID=3420 RepID=UPI0040639486
MEEMEGKGKDKMRLRKKDERKEHQNEVEFEPKVDKIRMKKDKRNHKKEASSSSAEIVARAVDIGNQRVGKDKRMGNDKESQGGKDCEKVEDVTVIKKGKNKRDKEGSDGNSFIMEKFDETYDQRKKGIANDKAFGRSKDRTDGDSREMVNVKKVRTKVTKDMDEKDTESGLAETLSRELINGRKKIIEEKEVAGNDGHTGSNSKKKRKREEEVAGLELGKDRKKKSKKVPDKVLDSGEKSVIEKVDTGLLSTKMGKGNFDDFANARRDSREMANVKKVRTKVTKEKDEKDSRYALAETLPRKLINGRKKITEEKEVADYDSYTGSNSKKKRKRENEVVDLELGKDVKKKSKKDKVTKPVGYKVQDKVPDSGKTSIIEDKVGKESSSSKRGKGNLDSTNVKGSKKSKRVSFSGQVEVFPLPNDMEFGEENNKRPLVQGKRFTPEEDKMIKEAVFSYIKARGLGEEGVDMVLHCHSHRHVKNCWKDIGASLPWRPCASVYHRAHSLFERAEERKWEPEELDLIRSHHAIHGPDWKTLAVTLGKNRTHVKDTWRRIKLPRKKAGFWSQDEYDTLFDLVNKDLQMKAFEEKKSKHGMLRDNIAWEAISDKLGTRTNMTCCRKWYHSLASSMVAKGLWDNADDYRLLEALLILNACCVEDIDWDCLLDDRPGEVCLKRWKQMTKHIGGYKDKPFVEQVELLAKRYCPNILEQES